MQILSWVAKNRLYLVIFLLATLSIGLNIYGYSKENAGKLIVSLTAPEPREPSLTWPDQGEASIGAIGYDLMTSNADTDKPFPTASMIKILAALCILEKNPLEPNESGPIITMTNEDVRRYETEVARNGNHLAIVEGEQLTQRQALEAILIESANNITDSLVIWSFGSMEGYKSYAENWLRQHDMHSTKLGSDSSGLDPATTSTHEDLLKLATIARDNQVIMKILSTPSAEFQTHGTVYNRNKNGNEIILGGKTGSLDGEKVSYLFIANTKNINPGIDIDLVGVVTDNDSSEKAISSSLELAKSAAQCFEKIQLAKQGDIIGKLNGHEIITNENFEIVRWCGSPIHISQSSQDAISAKSDGLSVTVPISEKSN